MRIVLKQLWVKQFHTYELANSFDYILLTPQLISDRTRPSLGGRESYWTLFSKISQTENGALGVVYHPIGNPS